MPTIGATELLIVLLCCGIPIVGSATAFIVWVLARPR